MCVLMKKRARSAPRKRGVAYREAPFLSLSLSLSLSLPQGAIQIDAIYKADVKVVCRHQLNILLFSPLNMRSS